VAIAPLEFNTPRLAFRNWRADHRPAFAAMNSDPEVMRYFPALQTADQSNATIDAWLAHFRDQGWGNWAVELLGTGEFIGFIGLNIPRRQLPFSPCIEVGWRLKRDAWGKGYATEGAKACLRHAFTRFGLAEIVSFTALVNTPSVAVMRRIGMANANADFEHPGVPEGSSLRPHCLYKASRSEWLRSDA
jgi:RimJ/RimL family protein N-acetyltransferase